MTKSLLYKFGILSGLVLVALWSFYALPVDNSSKSEQKALLAEEVIEPNPVISSPVKAKAALTTAKTPTPSPLPVSPSPTPAPYVSRTPSPTPTPVQTSNSSPTINTPAPTTASSGAPPEAGAPISTQTPEPTNSPEPSATPDTVGGHVFYLSTYHTSKYYYCDTDNGWKSLSATYLKSYPSESTLLADYPARLLHESCK